METDKLSNGLRSMMKDTPFKNLRRDSKVSNVAITTVLSVSVRTTAAILSRVVLTRTSRLAVEQNTPYDSIHVHTHNTHNTSVF